MAMSHLAWAGAGWMDGRLVHAQRRHPIFSIPPESNKEGMWQATEQPGMGISQVREHSIRSHSAKLHSKEASDPIPG